jgi:hypothetical protein
MTQNPKISPKIFFTHESLTGVIFYTCQVPKSPDSIKAMKACDNRLLLDGKHDDVPTPKHTFLPSRLTDSRNGETQKQSQLINSCWGTCMNLLVAESLRFAAGLSGLAGEREERVGAKGNSKPNALFLNSILSGCLGPVG